MTVKTDDFKSGKRDDDSHRRLDSLILKRYRAFVYTAIQIKLLLLLLLDAVRFRGEWVTYTSRYECLYL